MTETGAELRMAIAEFAARPRVLVAVDFDGTLAPIVDDPMQARSVSGGIEALRTAAGLDGVTVAVVSGRDLETLQGLTGLGPHDGVILIGSHGAETTLFSQDGQSDAQPSPQADLMNEDDTARLGVVGEELEAIRSRYPAARLEYKPSAVVLHTRGVEAQVAAAAASAAREVGGRHRGVHVMLGKDVVELTVTDADKGSALLNLARATASEATLYLGDDITDERAFAALNPVPGNPTVKVGAGETVAAHRVPDPVAVVALLQLLVNQRSTQTTRHLVGDDCEVSVAITAEPTQSSPTG